MVSSNEPLLFSFRLSGGIAMSIHICPYCLNPVIYFEKDWIDGEVKAVKVDTSYPECCAFLTRSIYANARCSRIQVLKTYAGMIAKKLGLSEEEKKLFLQKVVDLKKEHPRWKDYKILEHALNSIFWR